MDQTNRFYSWISRIPPDFGRTDTHVHFWLFIPLLAFQVWGVHRLGSLSPLAMLAFFVAGSLFWTLEEYLIHRFSFHAKSQHPLVRPFNSSLHLLHHNDPASKLYVGAPLVLAVPSYGINLLFFYFVSGSWDRAVMLGTGLLLGFLVYEYIHYATHQHPAKNRIMKILKKQHMLHHFADQTKRFGVTSPFWDIIFGTLK